MEIYKCLHCGFEFDKPYASKYGDECPNCGSEEMVRAEESDTANGWKKAWKELPEEAGWYLVMTNAGNITVLNFNMKHMAWNVTDSYTDAEIKVLYWMPLPPLPIQKRPSYDIQRDVDLVDKAMKIRKGDTHETD